MTWTEKNSWKLMSCSVDMELMIVRKVNRQLRRIREEDQ